MYNQIDWHSKWQMLRVYGVGEYCRKQCTVLMYICECSLMVCVWVGMGLSEWFPLNVGLRLGYVMSPWLCNIYVGGKWVLGKWLKLQHANNDILDINQLLFKDDQH